ncbi:hypothetical protein ABZ756_13600 [Mammaliicoccus sciuri]|uniref:Uncharacterized protein n=1 Tax=Sporosarcina newyorkensis TaxID=759851 RepID=A0A1T4YU03_9BACL|nr:hypothetical protein [Sporosarcina newyorkensis]SKB05242.1 hypothetical protein SAMN04244570_3594 [Sporosarcina newyorkensis]
MKKEKQSEKLRKELAKFVEKMQLEGIDIMTIKKPIDVGASISCAKEI